VIRYDDTPGIDPVTGRQCRLLTAQLLERLREYESGKRPTKIETSEPTFFDPRSGEPVVWYYKDRTGGIELFDLMGFHPQAGEELLPITADIAEAWKNQNEKRRKLDNGRIPQRVDPDNYSFFDPISGDARTWYWRGEKGDYEFYNNPGYHPRNGDQLKLFTKERLAIYLREAADDEQRRKAEAERAKRERARQDEENRREAERQEQLRREAQLKRDRETQSAKLCDQLAGNPTDPRRAAAEGVPFETLKAHADEAIDVCERAIAQYPNELRLQYQLARALAVNDRNRKRALPILQKLVAKRYAAAYDNLGWLVITERKNFAEAVSHFRAGIQLGDADAMVSLAEMIGTGHAIPMNRSETRLALYARASQLGHSGAARAHQVEQQKQDSPERQRPREFEQQEDGFKFLLPFLQRMPR
jgi:hypothetical protein